MSRITYYPETYICPHCQKEHQNYIWSNEAHLKRPHKHPCPQCGMQVGAADIYEKEVGEAPLIKTPTSSALVRKQRKRRNTDHFKKEVYPTLKRGSHEQKHFASKHGLK